MNVNRVNEDSTIDTKLDKRSSAITTSASNRLNNIVIHRMPEDSLFCDKDKVQDIFEAIGVECTPLEMFRLGSQEVNKNRPLLVRLNSKEEKNMVFSKLCRLKYVKRRFNERISITHDYTRQERRKIKELVEESKRRNRQNEQIEQFIWKVRGMQIIKICVRGREEDSTSAQKSTS